MIQFRISRRNIALDPRTPGDRASWKIDRDIGDCAEFVGNRQAAKQGAHLPDIADGGDVLDEVDEVPVEVDGMRRWHALSFPSFQTSASLIQSETN